MADSRAALKELRVWGRQKQIAGTIENWSDTGIRTRKGVGSWENPRPQGEQLEEGREPLPKFQSWLCYLVAV